MVADLYRPQWVGPVALGLCAPFGLLSALLVLPWERLPIPFIVTAVCLIRAWSRPPLRGGLS
ncbi:hypothetical protein [Acetobacter sp. LMG 32666]|uniref:hypothetical protein n=1 Tax=Acetobacter sp. LMG 32666 TaxID=2959295 RepID=UPI0030C7E5DD